MSDPLQFVPLVIALLATTLVLWTAHWLLLGRHREMGSERRFPRQLVMLALTILGIVAIALALPVQESTRNQIIAFIGLVVSGVLAFASTTIFANLMAGVMMRITRPFRAGDFIHVGEFFGRVAERGLLDTEIQTETRELIALPNTYLVTRPVSVIRSSGTIVTATLSLGYDLHHSRIEPLLAEAASACGLEDPFVQITNLGDHAITYKVNGMLREVKGLLTARSNLNRSVIDTLHREIIEIVSPAFMNQRRLEPDRKMVPPHRSAEEPPTTATAEELVFDKAEKAERREREKARLQKAITALQEALKNSEESRRTSLEAKLERAREALKQLEQEQSGKPEPE